MTAAAPTVSTVFVESFCELFEGVPAGQPTWVTSGGPEGGLYHSLARLSAAQASVIMGNTSVAAHTTHLIFAIRLVNDWDAGQEPISDWASSWQVKQVDGQEWERLQAELRSQAEALLAGPAARLDWSSPEFARYGFSSLAHTAYHLGVIRHMISQLEA